MRVLADFEGRWQFTREITHADGTVARAQGAADFTPARGGLAYLETGEIEVGGQALTFERAYHWQADLSVQFDDGRFFHAVPATGGQATHFCDPDTYVVTYDFGDWPEWHTTWAVSGPNKDYTMRTTYRPVSA